MTPVPTLSIGQQQLLHPGLWCGRLWWRGIFGCRCLSYPLSSGRNCWMVPYPSRGFLDNSSKVPHFPCMKQRRKRRGWRERTSGAQLHLSFTRMIPRPAALLPHHSLWHHHDSAHSTPARTSCQRALGPNHLPRIFQILSQILTQNTSLLPYMHTHTVRQVQPSHFLTFSWVIKPHKKYELLTNFPLFRTS